METLADNRRREEVIQEWMLAIVDDGGVRRFDDLHIDQIDSAWEDREHWVEGGLKAFRLAQVLRDRNGLPFTVGLSFSLASDRRALGVDFRTQRELEGRLNWSPPSLHLFQRGEEPRSQMALGDSVQDLNSSIFALQGAGVVCYYLEFLQKDAEECCRSVFIEG